MSAGEPTVYAGGCHCRTNRYRLHWPADGGAVPARCCGCTFCRSIGAAWTSHPAARLDLQLSVAQPPRRYRFGTGTADFLSCTACGVCFAVLGEDQGRRIAVVNVNTLDQRDALAFERSDTDFDGEDTAARLGRRAARWIGEVVVSEA